MPRLVFNFYSLVRQKKLPKSDKKGNFAILIPARNESKVIEDLLKALDEQNYDKEKMSAYIMVTDEKDETIEIAKKYSFVKETLVVPKNLNSKGKTLDICAKKLLNEGKKFDAYFIFDADNIPEKSFISKMNDVFWAGYEVGMGRRVLKNKKNNWVSVNSLLTFTFVNSLNNKFRTKLNGPITISGSGFFVSGSLIEKWGGFPFNSLAEDYELSRYMIVNDIKGYYREDAKVLDEQPVTIRQTNSQRLRWVKGHNNVDKMYNGKIAKQVFSFKTKNWFVKFDYLFNLIPPVTIMVGLALFFVICLVFTLVGAILANSVWQIAALYAVKTFGVLYAILAFYSLIGLLADREVIKVSPLTWIASFIMAPFYLMSWTGVYFKSFLVKDLKWKATKHGNDKKKFDDTKKSW